MEGITLFDCNLAQMIKGDSSIPPVAEVVVFNLSDRCRIYTVKRLKATITALKFSALSVSPDIATGVFTYFLLGLNVEKLYKINIF